MSRLQCRGSIAGAAVLVALLSSRPADAQIGVDPGPPREPGGCLNSVITGVEYDIVNQAHGRAAPPKSSGEAQARCRAGQHGRRGLRRPSDRQRQVSHRDRRMVDPVELAPVPRLLPDPDRSRVVRRHRSGHPPDAISLPPAVCARPRDRWPPPRRSRSRSSMPSRRGPASPSPSMASPIRPPPARARTWPWPPTAHITYDSGGSLGQRRYLISHGRLRVPIDRRGLGAIQAFGQALNRRRGLGPEVVGLVARPFIRASAPPAHYCRRPPSIQPPNQMIARPTRSSRMISATCAERAASRSNAANPPAGSGREAARSLKNAPSILPAMPSVGLSRIGRHT